MKVPSITQHQVIAGLIWIVTQAVAWGILNTGTSQTVVAVGGIVIGAVYALASALHLGRVHAAQVSNRPPTP